MKAKPKHPAIFLEIGKSQGRDKPRSSKQAFSFFQNSQFNSQQATPSTAAHVSSTLQSASGKRKCSLANQPRSGKASGLSQGIND